MTVKMRQVEGRPGNSVAMLSLRIFVVFFLLGMWSAPTVCQQINKAVKDNNLPEVRQLLKNDPNLVDSRDENGFTPLQLAAANGYKSMVEFLLTTKADVNAKDSAGTTPLHQAAAGGWPRPD